MSSKLQKISVSVVLTVAVDEWDLTYGTGTEPEVIQEDVRTNILGILEELTKGNSGAGDGAIKTVTPRWKS
jgi:hypothetical protein